jgi:hypothetical protein
VVLLDQVGLQVLAAQAARVGLLDRRGLLDQAVLRDRPVRLDRVVPLARVALGQVVALDLVLDLAAQVVLLDLAGLVLLGRLVLGLEASIVRDRVCINGTALRGR